MADDGRQAAVVAEGDVAQFYLACQFDHVGQFIAKQSGGAERVTVRQTQVGALRLTVRHLLDALDRRVDSQSGLYAGNSPDDGIDGLVDESLGGQDHAGRHLALQDEPSA